VTPQRTHLQGYAYAFRADDSEAADVINAALKRLGAW
jgi:hypothetical protein